MRSTWHQGGYRNVAGARWAFAALPGFIVGTALQLQQAALWFWPIYACFVALAIGLYWVAATKHIVMKGGWWRRCAAFAMAAALAFSLCGLRATAFRNDAWPPGWRAATSP